MPEIIQNRRAFFCCFASGKRFRMILTNITLSIPRTTSKRTNTKKLIILSDVNKCSIKDFNYSRLTTDHRFFNTQFLKLTTYYFSYLQDTCKCFLQWQDLHTQNQSTPVLTQHLHQFFLQHLHR